MVFRVDLFGKQNKTKQTTLQAINELDTYGPLMALHVTIIIWQIYMVITIELNVQKRFRN